MAAAIRSGFSATLMATVIACAGCTSSSSTVARSTEAGTEAGSLYPSQLPPDFHCDPTLESVRETIFLTSCKWDSCHGDNNAQWGLNLVTDVATVESELVGVPAATCNGWNRVTKGDPEHSLLFNKVSQRVPACGERMPWGVVPLPPEALDCIEGWIRNQ
ncbi:MAG TPA: hypothetical protein VHE30_19115 [Polyangiaceae bacterium]|nr:hypothetical protein [Polyangiaceae bacterium]